MSESEVCVCGHPKSEHDFDFDNGCMNGWPKSAEEDDGKPGCMCDDYTPNPVRNWPDSNGHWWMSTASGLRVLVEARSRTVCSPPCDDYVVQFNHPDHWGDGGWQTRMGICAEYGPARFVKLTEQFPEQEQ